MWFKAITLSALCLMAFSFFYYYVIFLPKMEKARVERETRERAKQEEKDKAREAAASKPVGESTSLLEQHEKAKRELEKAQVEFERQVREDQARERQKQERVRQAEEQLARQRSTAFALNQCLAQADASYHAWWDETCRLNGQPAGCGLPSPNATRLDQSHRADRDECYRRYSPH